jgi:hypothetical protein
MTTYQAERQHYYATLGGAQTDFSWGLLVFTIVILMIPVVAFKSRK